MLYSYKWFYIHIKTGDFYKVIARYVEAKFNSSNYEVK